jgi:N-methylhydantoinase A
VALRLSLAAPMPGAQHAIDLGHAGRSETAGVDAVKGHRPVLFPELEAAVVAPVYDRYALRAGTRFPGPAIVEENESTFVIGPGGRAEILPDGSIAVEIPE